MEDDYLANHFALQGTLVQHSVTLQLCEHHARSGGREGIVLVNHKHITSLGKELPLPGYCHWKWKMIEG